jgi:Flp pilus assembly protein TadG
MTQEGICSFLAGKLRRFGRDEAGVSALEFAMLLPLMVTLYLGGVEISQAVSADRKTTLVAHTVGDLVAQVSDITTAGTSDVLNAATAVAYPFPVSNLKVTVTSVCVNSTGTVATVAWSKTLNGTQRSGNVTTSVPATLMTAAAATGTGASLIWGEASYAYKPTVGWTITGTLTMNDKIFLVPRLSKSVTLDEASSCP